APTTEISISTSTSTASSTSTATSTTTTTAASPSCVPPSTTTPINATPADDTGRDWDITSVDGTVIRAHWFPLPGLADDQVAPTILMGPGWGSAGDTNEGNVGVLGALSIKMLRDNGYNVLTWDPRGFGASTGSAEVDSVDYEARDVQQLID